MRAPRFGQEVMDAVVVDLNDDGVEATLIAREFEALAARGLPVIILTPDGRVVGNGAAEQANAEVREITTSPRLDRYLERLVA